MGQKMQLLMQAGRGKCSRAEEEENRAECHFSKNRVVQQTKKEASEDQSDVALCVSEATAE